MAMRVSYLVIDGEIVYENRGGVERDYLPDPQGNTIALLDSSQTKTDTWVYFPYGEVKTRTGSSTTPFQYCGTLGYYTDASGKLYVRARYLDVVKGRWVTPDPIGFRSGDINLYRYGGSSPVSNVDPTGTSIYSCWAWGRSVGHLFLSTDLCGAWGFRKDGLGCIGKGIVEPDEPYLEGGKPGYGKFGVFCRKLSLGPAIEDALCKCISASKSNPPMYCIGLYDCGGWRQSMVGCACRAVKKKDSSEYFECMGYAGAV